MKNTDAFDNFEQLLQNKAYSELSNEELALVAEFASEEDYEQMAKLIQDLKKYDSNEIEAPKGGVDEIWNKVEISQTPEQKIIPFRKRKVSVLWPMSIAASLLLVLFVNFPQDHSVFVVAANRNVSIYSFMMPVKTEVVKEVPVYINQNNYADIVMIESDAGSSYSGDFYLPEPESITNDKAQRQGRNTSEMGDMTQMFVNVN
ncbi:MAG: hypothetical protein JXR53_12610 [Bacteroidales bacterium]|nr:hypothetical protein [Bacteroidales bacterium]